MTEQDLARQRATKRLVDVISDLSTVSHVTGTSYDRSGGGGGAEASSGAPPPGGVDAKGDREPAYRQRSAQYFARRVDGLVRRLPSLSVEEAESIRDEILRDAETALRDWRKTPPVPGKDPDHGTLAWKIKVANDARSSRIAAGHYGISHVTVLRLRRQYQGVTE